MKKILYPVLFLVLLFIFSNSLSIVSFARSSDDSETSADYPDYKKITTKGTFDIPGLEHTEVRGEDCDCMTPQGICVAGDYILVTAYCRVEKYKEDLQAHISSGTNKEKYDNEAEHNEHDSVIYVISKSTHDLLKTIVIDDPDSVSRHVGGIAFDGTYVYIAKSKRNKLGVLTLDQINDAVSQSGDAVLKCKDVYCDCLASFVTYFDGKLWVGKCTADRVGLGTFTAFDISGESIDTLKLIAVKEITIPEVANGAAFASIDGEVCLAVNSSLGRNNDTVTSLFSVNLDNDSDVSVYTDYGTYTLPPMAEEICVDGSEVYTLFESGSSDYSNVDGNMCSHVVTKICIANLNDWFYWHDSNYQDEEHHATEEDPIYEGMYYEPTNAIKGKYIPNYVELDTNAETQTLYNPYAVEMACDMAEAAYDIKGNTGLEYAATSVSGATVIYNVDGSFTWSKALSKYGYTQIKSVIDNGVHELGSVKTENGTQTQPFSSVNATIGIKEIIYNGQKKYSIAIAFRGTHDFEDVVTDVSISKNGAGLHSGFAEVSRSFYDTCSQISFTIDGKKVYLSEMLESMKDEDSKYKLFVTGHSLGGAVADIFVGYDLYKAEVYPGNVVAYTFAAARSASSSYSYPYTNIFNIINNDDVVPRVGNDKQIGTNIVYTPDEDFRAQYYPELNDLDNFLNGVSSGAFSKVKEKVAAHKLSTVYKKIVSIINNDTDDYISNTTNGIRYDKFVLINRDSYCCYSKNIDVYELSVYEANIIVGTDCIISGALIMSDFKDFLLVENDFSVGGRSKDRSPSLQKGTVEVKGDFTEKCFSDGVGGKSGSAYQEYGQHKTILSGSKAQTVSFECGNYSQEGGFENLVIKNSRISFEGSFYYFKLGADAEITTDSVIAFEDVFDLKGYRLITEGSVVSTYETLYKDYGSFYMNGGSFDIGGELRCYGLLSLSSGECSCGKLDVRDIVFSGTRLHVKEDARIKSALVMKNSEDYLLVDNKFTIGGYRSSGRSISLGEGTIEVKGDFTEYCIKDDAGGKASSAYHEYGQHKTILSGSKAQTVSFECGNYSEDGGFENLIIKNPQISFEGSFYYFKLGADAEITTDSVIAFEDAFDLKGYRLITNGSVVSTYETLYKDYGSFYMNEGSFDIGGELRCYGLLSLSSGECSCGKLDVRDIVFSGTRLHVKEDARIKSALVMKNSEDYLLVDDEFTIGGYRSSDRSISLEEGTIEVKGDFTEYCIKDDAGGKASSAYHEYGQHKTILSGSKAQTVSFECGNYSEDGGFENLIIKNSQISFEGSFYYFKLGADAEITIDSVIAFEDVFDLKGYRLITNGSVVSTYETLYKDYGSFYMNGGSFEIGGELRCYGLLSLSSGECSCGKLDVRDIVFSGTRLHVKEDARIKSALVMKNSEDYLLVDNKFTIGGYRSSGRGISLGEGTIEVKGDFTEYCIKDDAGGKASSAYHEYGQHKTIFSGEKEQIISFEGGTSSYKGGFENLIINNPLITFDGSIYNIRLASDAEISTDTTIYYYGEFDLNGFGFETNGSVVSGSYNSKHETGELVTNDGNFKVKGELKIDGVVTLSDGNYSCGSFDSYKLVFNNSRMSVDTDVSIGTGGLYMTNENDYLLINGDFVVYKNTGSNISNGTVEIKGDFVEQTSLESYGGYQEIESHKTILSGDKKQSVNLITSGNRYGSKYSTLIIENVSDEGVVFESSINVNTLFNHNQNNYTLKYENYSSFVDYDEDGLKDNKDRFPLDKDISIDDIKIKEVEKQKYTGDKIEPDLSITFRDKPLIKDVDYTVKFSKNINPGKATATISGVDNFVGDRSVEFDIYCEHNYKEVAELKETCTEGGMKAHYECSICHSLFIKENDEYVEKEEKDLKTNATGHNLTEHVATEPTYDEVGNSAYWSCDRCNKFFSDKEATTEIEEGSWIISKLTPGPTPTVGPTAEPTSEPTSGPTTTPNGDATPTPIVGPTPTPEIEVSPTPVTEPTETPEVKPTVSPTEEPTATPSKEPLEEPTTSPTTSPSATPINEPTATPTMVPSSKQTAMPTKTPIAIPTKTPIVAPTEKATPTVVPTATSAPAVIKDNVTTFSVKNKKTIKKTAKIKVKDKDKIKKITLNGKKVKIKKNKTSITVKLKSYKKALKKKGKWNTLKVTDYKGNVKSIKFKTK